MDEKGWIWLKWVKQSLLGLWSVTKKSLNIAALFKKIEGTAEKVIFQPIP